MFILLNDTAEVKQCAQNLNSALSSHKHVKRLLLIHEFYEITQETQWLALPLDPRSTPVFQLWKNFSAEA